MPKDILETIKDISQEVAEEYTLLNKDMNDSLLSLINAGLIENDEILKRICEQANQNVYLALFHNPDTDNSNIIFDVADFNKILANSKEGDTVMTDYITPPKDFRSSFEVAVAEPMNKEASDKSRMDDLNTAIEYRQTLRNFRSAMECIKTAELNSAEESFNKMLCDTRDMVSNGESIGDISKIATRFVKENLGGDFMKVAQCYDVFNTEMVASGFNVKTGFTKLSSQRIHDKSRVLEPVREFAMSMAKIAGASDILKSVEQDISVMDKLIK